MDSALQGERRRFPGGTRPSSSRERHTRASPQELSHRLPAPRTRPSLERPFSADTRRRQGPPGPSRGSVWFRTVLSFLASASQLQDEMEQPFPQERSLTRLRPPPRVVPVTGRAPSSSSARGFRLHRSPSLCSTVLGHVPQTQSSDTKPSRWGPVCTPSTDGSPARGPRPSRLFYCRAAASHCRSTWWHGRPGLRVPCGPSCRAASTAQGARPPTPFHVTPPLGARAPRSVLAEKARTCDHMAVATGPGSRQVTGHSPAGRPVLRLTLLLAREVRAPSGTSRCGPLPRPRRCPHPRGSRPRTSKLGRSAAPRFYPSASRGPFLRTHEPS